MPPKRILFLHLSALSDAEYTVYIEALRDIVDDGEKPGVSDEELETRKISLPVVRAWMKGRFRDLGHADIDKVLQLFAPQMPQNEMSGGQLLAALRLLMHVRRGGDVNEGSVFIQAEPSSPTVSRHSTFPANSRNICESKPTTDMPLPSNPWITVPNPFLRRGLSSEGLTPPDHIDPDSPRRASLSSAPPVPPPTPKPRVDGFGVPPGSTNPFLQRAKTHSGTYEPSSTGRTPPLPPRKPSHMSSSIAPSKPAMIPSKPPPSVPLLVNASGNSSSGSSTSVKNPPPVPPHRVTPLMQQSLLASRVGASLKKAQEEAGRTRILEVIRSSSDVSVPHDRARMQSSSRSPDKGTRRPVPQPPRPPQVISTARSDSGAPSIASLAEIASARLVQPRTRTRTASPDCISYDSSSSDKEEPNSTKTRQLSASDQLSPPPTHPARRPSAHSSGRGRHLRSPSYQAYSLQHSPATDPSSLNKSTSTPGGFRQNHLSRSPSPSPAPNSPTQSRPSRSHSLHQSSSPTLAGRLTEGSSPLPSSQRKRPESAQFTPRSRLLELDRRSAPDIDPTSQFANSFGVQDVNSEGHGGGGGIVSSMATRFDKPSYRSTEREWDRDRDRGKEKEQNAFSSLQRTFSTLQQKAQPAITRARFKAEAGILAPRRGFVPNGREYQMAGEDGDRLVSQHSTDDEGGMDFAPATDTDYDDCGNADDTIRARGRSRSENAKHYSVERDNLKLPEGEGWTRL